MVLGLWGLWGFRVIGVGGLRGYGVEGFGVPKP